MNGLNRAAASLVGLACFPMLALGVVITQELGEVGKAKDKMIMYVNNGKIRVEQNDARGGKTIMIFDGDKQVLWMIQQDQGTYMEMTQATVAEMGQMAGQANAQMAQAMKELQNLPPEQRAMAEQMMKGRMGAMGGAPPAAPTITFKAKGSDRSGSFTCTKYDELSNGSRTAEICAAPFDQIHITAADRKTFEAMGKFFEPLARMAPRAAFRALRTEEINGFPVHTVSYNGDTPAYETTVLSAEQKSIDAGLFTLPPGLKRSEERRVGKECRL